ncbi:MAG: hypothetical protein IKR85_02865 [Clostridia bacterium]|nr:hypothetical protein [Clostridia bacterium]
MNGFRQFLARFMAGRRGMDELGGALYLLGLILWVISLFAGGIFSVLPLVLWGYSIFRSLSRNINARARENEWFLAKFGPLRKKASQAYVRFKNRRIYLYYRCPQCKSWLKLPRNIGEKKVTCSHCGATFVKKA